MKVSLYRALFFAERHRGWAAFFVSAFLALFLFSATSPWRVAALFLSAGAAFGAATVFLACFLEKQVSAMIREKMAAASEREAPKLISCYREGGEGTYEGAGEELPDSIVDDRIKKYLEKKKPN